MTATTWKILKHVTTVPVLVTTGVLVVIVVGSVTDVESVSRGDMSAPVIRRGPIVDVALVMGPGLAVVAWPATVVTGG